MDRLADMSLPDRVLQTQPVLVPTTLMIASIVALFSTLNRKVEPRAKVAEFLRCLVDAACKTGSFQVNIPMIESDGTYTLRSQSLSAGNGATLFTQSMLKEVQFTWMSELTSDQKPWISTIPERPHLADFISFALDPIPVRARKRNHIIADMKKLLRAAALGLLTQLAVFYCSVDYMRHATDPMSKRVKAFTGVQKKETKYTLWPRFATALDLLKTETAPCLFVM